MEQNTNQQHSALLVMDIQNITIKMLPESNALIASLVKTIETAHANNIPVIYVIIAFRPGFPEVSPANKSFSAIKNNKTFTIDAETGFRVYAGVTPLDSDIVVTKRRVSAFTGSDLEVVLRAQGIKHIVLTGISTSGVVLSTLREAADKDYGITVLSDCCADLDEEVHRILTTKVFPRQATVIKSEEWLKQ